MDRWYIFVVQNNVWIEGEIMLFQTIGKGLNPVILFFHAMTNIAKKKVTIEFAIKNGDDSETYFNGSETKS